MIAVFTRSQQDYDRLDMRPRKLFVRVRRSDDIRGRKFLGVIRVYDWHLGDRQILDAHDILETRQPEIFYNKPNAHQAR